LIIDEEIKAAYLGRPVSTVADDVEFWYRAGYDCATRYPDAPTMWFFMDEERSDTILEDGYTATGYRRWASEGRGLIGEPADLERYPVPSVDEIDFSYFETACEHLPDGMGLIGAWGDIFTYTWEAMGFEAFCFGLYEQEDFVAHIFNLLGKLAVDICEVLVSYEAVKAFWFSDDIAYRTGFLISPAVYRQYLFPWMTQMGDLCRQARKPFMFHSDGVLWDVIPDLLDCGVCALHPIEPIAMDIREVKRRYGEWLCLVGNVEVDTLSRGTRDQIREQVRALLRDVAPGGGYCLGSSNTVPNYAQLANFEAMVTEGWKLGEHPIRV
jgi:uroporphyrinogen decarboxylase